MKLFLLIHEQDTDAAWGSSVDLFSTLEAAQANMGLMRSIVPLYLETVKRFTQRWKIHSERVLFAP